jgi:hypothetical protein
MLVAVITAPGTMAPDGSVIVPAIAPVSPVWATDVGSIITNIIVIAAIMQKKHRFIPHYLLKSI